MVSDVHTNMHLFHLFFGYIKMHIINLIYNKKILPEDLTIQLRIIK